MPPDKTAPAQTDAHCRPEKDAGIGLRSGHYEDFINQKPDIGWIEVHPENYFGGGLHRHYLGRARETYPVSFHAVGLSLGSAQPVDKNHLRQIKELIDIYEPFHVSDHASWSAGSNAHLNDLLPLPRTYETLQTLCENIQRTQDAFKRRILVENPSTYVSFAVNDMDEATFMNEAAKKTGCSILLDVNNIYVQAHNHNFDPYTYIDTLKTEHVEEIHLAGHVTKTFESGTLLIDTHNRPVRDEVWALYKYAIEKTGPVPTLIEWDKDLPPLDVLCAQARNAQKIMDEAAADKKVAHAMA